MNLKKNTEHKNLSVHISRNEINELKLIARALLSNTQPTSLTKQEVIVTELQKMLTKAYRKGYEKGYQKGKLVTSTSTPTSTSTSTGGSE